MKAELAASCLCRDMKVMMLTNLKFYKTMVKPILVFELTGNQGRSIEVSKTFWFVKVKGCSLLDVLKNVVIDLESRVLWMT